MKNYQIGWADIQRENKTKRREAMTENIATIILIILLALFFYALNSGMFAPDCINK